MLPRTEFEMAENIRDFEIAVDDGCLVGCGALHYYTRALGSEVPREHWRVELAAEDQRASGRSAGGIARETGGSCK